MYDMTKHRRASIYKYSVVYHVAVIRSAMVCQSQIDNGVSVCFLHMGLCLNEDTCI